ncbi:DUF805 domain-containing protein [Agromyces sp. MMS24-K17]|uniref:DUF805 domain-containing protein n=1 Tax=Agromyces sp. MMS24-K17 TaxID=3372850 RepID=UPI003754ADFD
MSNAPAPQSAPAAEVPLSAPLYGASFGQAIQRFFKKYATFSGRASRSEYWWWALANYLIITVLYILIAVGGAYDPNTGLIVAGPLAIIAYVVLGIYGLAVIVPNLAITWRRLHDTNRSGGFFFLALIPFVGWIILLVLTLLPTNPAGSRFDA